jgi:uncharacterized protein
MFVRLPRSPRGGRAAVRPDRSLPTASHVQNSYQELPMRIPALVLAFTLSFAAAAGAQSPRVSPTHTAAAVELVRLMNVNQEAVFDMLGAMRTGLAPDNPMAIQMSEVMTAFMKEFMPPAKLEEISVEAYTDAYTESELRQLIAFYKTPLGQKTIEKQSEILKVTTAATQKLIVPHMPELQRRIMAKIGGGM